MERALLVTVELESERDSWSFEDKALELKELVSACGVDVVESIYCRRQKPSPNLFIGSGKAEEAALVCQQENIDTVIFSHDLSGTQQRNLEELIGKKTIDRTQLILDIFARHAHSPEGKTQVELAQLQYLLPRLVGKGIILSRLGGGVGTRGPGEQELEVDRRRIRKRIDRLNQELKQFSSHRATIRKKRLKDALPSVSLVGYTNAGKSTLLNALTDAGQEVRDGLFTTLDTLYKALQLPNGENIVISDTVGFLHNLPHHLIEAFKATLDEVVSADLLIHVLDAHHPRVYEHNKAVIGVLKELNAQDKPIITALNKIDLLDDMVWLGKLKADFVNAQEISAKTKQNLDLLLNRIQGNFAARMVNVKVMIPHSRMDLVNLFYKEGKVAEVKYLQKGVNIKAFIPKVLFSKLLHNKEIEEA